MAWGPDILSPVGGGGVRSLNFLQVFTLVIFADGLYHDRLLVDQLRIWQNGGARTMATQKMFSRNIVTRNMVGWNLVTPNMVCRNLVTLNMVTPKLLGTRLHRTQPFCGVQHFFYLPPPLGAGRYTKHIVSVLVPTTIRHERSSGNSLISGEKYF